MHTCPSFTPLMPVLPTVALPISLLFSLSLPPFRFRGILCTLIISTIVYLTWISPFPPASLESSGTTQIRYGFLAAWFWYLPTIQKLLCTVPEEAFWRIRLDEKGNDVGEKEALKMKGWNWEKVKWAAELLANPRGVGWNFQISGMGKATLGKTDKRRFVGGMVRRGVLDYVAVEVGMAVVRWAIPEGEGVAALGMGKKVVVGMACLAVIRCSWELQWCFAGLVGVVSGLSTPDAWPPLFGPLSKCTSLAYFWGTGWQQVLKHSLLGFSTTLINHLHIRRGTTLAYAIHLYVAFFLSGLFHILTLCFLLPSTTPSVRNSIILSNATFFLLQPLGILLESYIRLLFLTLEILVETAEGHLDPPGSAFNIGVKVVGFVWTAAFLGATGWPFLKSYLSVGMRHWDVPARVVLPVVEWVCNGREGEGVCVWEGVEWGVWGKL